MNSVFTFHVKNRNLISFHSSYCLQKLPLKQTKLKINQQKTRTSKSFKTTPSTSNLIIKSEKEIEKWITKSKSILFGSLLLSISLLASGIGPFNNNTALADLNKFEADIGGEFGKGTAQQYGEADLKGRDFSSQDLTRSNFTAADCRDANFKDSKLIGAYFIKVIIKHHNIFQIIHICKIKCQLIRFKKDINVSYFSQCYTMLILKIQI